MSSSYVFQAVSRLAFASYKSSGTQRGLLIYDKNFERIFWFYFVSDSLHYSCVVQALHYHIGFASAYQRGFTVP